MMAEDYGDLDSEKVVLSFRGRGADEEINCVDKCLKELIARRKSEHEKQPCKRTPQHVGRTMRQRWSSRRGLTKRRLKLLLQQVAMDMMRNPTSK